MATSMFKSFSVTACMLALSTCTLLYSPSSWSSSKQDERAQMLTAITSGDVLPMRQIIDLAQKQRPGYIIDVELDHEYNKWIYEIKFFNQSGATETLKLDAKTGDIISK